MRDPVDTLYIMDLKEENNNLKAIIKELLEMDELDRGEIYYPPNHPITKARAAL